MRRRSKQKQPTIEKTLVAQSLGTRGDAVFEGPVYAGGVLPGETARLSVTGQRAQLLEIVDADSARIQPFCAVADRCGGCSLQHFDEAAYRIWKRGLAVEALSRAGIELDLPEIIDAHGLGRRRLTFHARRFGQRLVFGFNERAGDRIADLAACPVAVEAIDQSIGDFRIIADSVAGPKGRVDFAVTASDSGLDIHIDNVKIVDLALRELLAERATARKWARVSVNEEPIIQLTEPYVTLGKAKVVPPPGGFLQATSAGEAALSDMVVRAFESARDRPTHAVDLYAGSGAFALRLAQHIPVLALEGEGGPLQALKSAAAQTSGLKPVEARVRDLALEPLSVKELEAFDFAVIDPPRSGAQTQMERLADSAVPVICSISCNPITFARDAAILMEGGYQIKDISLIDQFKWTAHLEIAAIFARR
jgi:23S rRNA (uracil1939-C5)-methyltransferase